MIKNYKLYILMFYLIFTSGCIYAQNIDTIKYQEKIYTSEQLETMLNKPDCLYGYYPNQTGFLSKVDSNGKEFIDTTFTIQQIKIPSGDVNINGWLYLPLGSEKHPLVILTNGGGCITRNIRSFSDWMAPILAHCGIAAFVHDKRGTGESEGIFRNTTYEDYITDAGNCARYFFNHPRVDNKKIGVIGASEGGRIAVIAASRYSEFSFVISFAGSVASMVDDRIYAMKGFLNSMNLPDSLFKIALDIHSRSIIAWASNNPNDLLEVDKEIADLDAKFDYDFLPLTKEQADTMPESEEQLSTWRSLKYDYLSELDHFNKKWLAAFGKEDIVVPTEASVKNIIYYMNLSGNESYNIAIIPDCGHAPTNIKTKRLIRIDNLIVNWIIINILNDK